MKRLFLLAAPVFLTACTTVGVIGVDTALPAGDPAQEALAIGECEIYFAAAETLAAEGRDAPASLTRGCPEAAAATGAVDIAPMVSPPPMMSGYPTTLEARMRARGMPDDLADQVVQSKAFWDLVARRDSLVAGF